MIEERQPLITITIQLNIEQALALNLLSDFRGNSKSGKADDLDRNILTLANGILPDLEVINIGRAGASASPFFYIQPNTTQAVIEAVFTCRLKKIETIER